MLERLTVDGNAAAELARNIASLEIQRVSARPLNLVFRIKLSAAKVA